MELVRTTKVIDELLARAAEKALSERLLDDYEKMGTLMDASLPIALCTDAIQGLLRGDYIFDAKGRPFEESLTDSEDPDDWKSKIEQARTAWTGRRKRVAYWDKLTLKELQEVLDLPTKQLARRAEHTIARELLGATIVLESLETAQGLLERGWEPGDSCRRLRHEAIDWLVGALGLPQSVATEAKRGKFYMGLSCSEHYSVADGLYLDSSNVTRVRCELRFPDPLRCIIARRITIVHEAVHAVTLIHAGPEQVNKRNKPFWEGIAELCTWHYLEHKLDKSEDWLCLPHSAAYYQTPQAYIQAYLDAKLLFELADDYQILLELVEMKPFTVNDATIGRVDVIDCVKSIVQILGRPVAGLLVQNIMKATLEESVPMPRILYAAGGLSQGDLLGLVKKFDETWKDLVELCAAFNDVQ